MQQYEKLVFVDLETTGANIESDHITEVGIVEVDTSDGMANVTRWSALVNPGMPIPPFIQKLTGISDEMVRDAPAFSVLADEVMSRLEGRLFIAHNARFDYGFLRKALMQAGHVLRNEVVCTVKLSRALFPDELKHNLDSQITRHDLMANARHRALADADLLSQLWDKLRASTPPTVFDSAVKQQLRRSFFPLNLASDRIDEIPETAGIYVLYGASNDVIFIGKGSNLRQRVAAHFNPDRRARADTELADLVHRIEWQEIIGELGSLLAEAKLLRTFKPPHNRAVRRQSELCSWTLPRPALDAIRPQLVFAKQQDFGNGTGLYGLFGTRRKAEAKLRELAATQNLCLVLMGLEERTRADAGCVAHGANRCSGACVGLEDPLLHQMRMEAALSDISVHSWPYSAPVGLVETSRDGRQDIHVVHNWRYLGTARTDDEIKSILNEMPRLPSFDLDIYKILVRFVTKDLVQVRVL